MMSTFLSVQSGGQDYHVCLIGPPESSPGGHEDVLLGKCKCNQAQGCLYDTSIPPSKPKDAILSVVPVATHCGWVRQQWSTWARQYCSGWPTVDTAVVSNNVVGMQWLG